MANYFFFLEHAGELRIIVLIEEGWSHTERPPHTSKLCLLYTHSSFLSLHHLLNLERNREKLLTDAMLLIPLFMFKANVQKQA